MKKTNNFMNAFKPEKLSLNPIKRRQQKKQQAGRGPESGKGGIPLMQAGTDHPVIQETGGPAGRQSYLPQHCLYFLPEPQGHGSLRPIFFPLRTVLDSLCSLYSLFNSSSE